jgi:hypothetical protein
MHCRLDSILQNSKRISVRSRYHLSPYHYRHSTLRCNHHIGHQPNLRRILLESLRAPPSHPESLLDPRNTSRNILLRSSLPRFSNGTVYRPQCHLHRYGHGSSLPPLDQHQTWMLHPHHHRCCYLSLEFRQQRHYFHHCS